MKACRDPKIHVRDDVYIDRPQHSDSGLDSAENNSLKEYSKIM